MAYCKITSFQPTTFWRWLILFGCHLVQHRSTYLEKRLDCSSNNEHIGRENQASRKIATGCGTWGNLFNLNTAPFLPSVFGTWKQLWTSRLTSDRILFPICFQLYKLDAIIRCTSCVFRSHILLPQEQVIRSHQCHQSSAWPTSNSINVRCPMLALHFTWRFSRATGHASAGRDHLCICLHHCRCVFVQNNFPLHPIGTPLLVNHQWHTTPQGKAWFVLIIRERATFSIINDESGSTFEKK